MVYQFSCCGIVDNVRKHMVAMNSKASRTSTTIPLYLQISESITREIAAGRYTDGDRLPPERELAAQFATTVRTLRKALAELEKLGMLERIHGSGNYVRANEQARSIYSMFRLELLHGGGLPTADIISVRELNKPVGAPMFGQSKLATRVRRLRYLDGTEVAVEEIWLDRDSGRIIAAELGDSLYRYYQIKLGFWITRAEDRVSVATLPQWAPDCMETQSDSANDYSAINYRAFGYIERLSWAQGQSPVEYSRTWFDPRRAHYVQRLK
jgi:GntR family transcriptional regulator